MRNTDNDMDLLEAFNARERRALEEVYTRYYHRMYFVARKYTRDHHAAEDVTMDVLTRLLEKDIHFTTLARLEGYLFTSCRNAAIDLLRKKTASKAHRQFTQEDDMMESVEWDLIQAEYISHIRNMLQQLPDKYRQVLTLLYYEESRSQEAADQLNLSKRTVERYRREALEIIRQVFANAKSLEIISFMGVVLTLAAILHTFLKNF